MQLASYRALNVIYGSAVIACLYCWYLNKAQKTIKKRLPSFQQGLGRKIHLKFLALSVPIWVDRMPEECWSCLSVYLFQGVIKHIDLLDTVKSFEVMNYKRMYTQRRDFESHSTWTAKVKFKLSKSQIRKKKR